MSLQYRISAVAAVLVALLAGCDREDRYGPANSPAKRVPAIVTPDTIFPGNAPQSKSDPRAVEFENNAPSIAQGQTLFAQMNCSGCHSHGGGGMGPALMDGKWRYGGRIDQIVASIAEGRPNGMPSWRGKLTTQQMWQIAAFVRTLSGQERKDAVAARADEMSNAPPQTQAKREPVHSAESGQQ